MEQTCPCERGKTGTFLRPASGAGKHRKILSHTGFRAPNVTHCTLVFLIFLNWTKITLGEALGGASVFNELFQQKLLASNEEWDEEKLSTHQALLVDLSAWIQAPSDPPPCALNIVNYSVILF